MATDPLQCVLVARVCPSQHTIHTQVPSSFSSHVLGVSMTWLTVCTENQELETKTNDLI